jgi:uncharacterized protein (TIGR01244 family)
MNPRPIVWTPLRLIAPALLIALAAAGCANPVPPDQNADVKNLVHEDRFFIAGTPTEAGLRRMAREGVKTVIDLRREDEPIGDEAKLAEALGMRYFHIPLKSDAMSFAQANQFLEAMELAGNESVLIHCAGGSRAGAMYGLYLGARGICSPDEAVRRAKQAGLRNERLGSDVRGYLDDAAMRRVATPSPGG